MGFRQIHITVIFSIFEEASVTKFVNIILKQESQKSDNTDGRASDHLPVRQVFFNPNLLFVKILVYLLVTIYEMNSKLLSKVFFYNNGTPKYLFRMNR